MLRSLTGLNTQKYIQNKVIEQSKDLLSSTKLSVAEIAYTIGFNSPTYFTRVFRKRYGVLPTTFAKL